jgi:hypothetical protein
VGEEPVSGSAVVTVACGTGVDAATTGCFVAVAEGKLLATWQAGSIKSSKKITNGRLILMILAPSALY